jgi:hypothetical protein
MMHTSEWQGQKGVRQIFYQLTASRRIPIEGNQGNLAFLYIFVDQKGNRFKWITNGSHLAPIIGKAYDLDAMVKKHETYKGVKSTFLVRVRPASGRHPRHRYATLRQKIAAVRAQQEREGNTDGYNSTLPDSYSE